MSVNKEGDWWGDRIILSQSVSATGPFVVWATIPAPVKCADCNSFFATWIPRSVVRHRTARYVFALSHNRWDGEISALYRPTFHQVAALPYLPGRTAMRVRVPGAGGVDAVVLNLTTTRNTAPGYLTVFPCGHALPVASNLNHLAGQTAANLVIARPDANGDVCVYSLADTDLVADEAGVFPPGSGYQSPATPRRLVDTRIGLGAPIGPVPAGGTVRVDVPDGIGRVAVALNVTATAAVAPGHLTVHPCDRPRPSTSNVNVLPGRSVANLVLVRPDAQGRVCIAASAEMALVVDQSGTFGAAAGFAPADNPVRLVDTRDGTGAAPGRLAGGAVLRVAVPGAAGAPAVAINVTATGTLALGVVTAYPCDRPAPVASNVNSAPGAPVANLVVVRPDGAGRVCLLTSSPTHLVVDLAGTFTPTSPYASVDNPVRVLDTRVGIGTPGST